MLLSRRALAVISASSFIALASCQTAPPPVIPAAFTPLGVSAPYLSGDVIGGSRARATKMRAAKIRPLNPALAPSYIAELDSELRRQTAGIGLDVLQVGNGIVIRIPAALTFDALSTATLTGTVATIAPSATVSQNVVTYPVQIEFDPGATPIKVGMSATADIQVQKVENAKQRGAYVVSINATQLFALDFPKIETRPRHFH